MTQEESYMADHYCDKCKRMKEYCSCSKAKGMKEALVYCITHKGTVDTRINRVLQYNKHEISNTIPEYKEPKGKLLYGIRDASMGMTGITETNEGIYWNGELNLQHLYLITDEEIKEGNWFLSDERNNIHENNGTPIWVLLQCTSVENGWINTKTKGIGYNPSWTRKIVASTDPRLWEYEGHKGAIYTLKIAKIPQSFIEQYIDSQGTIKKVMLEEEYDNDNCTSVSKDYNKIKKLKLNSSGEVIIHLINQEWDYILGTEYKEYLKGNKNPDAFPKWLINNYLPPQKRTDIHPLGQKMYTREEIKTVITDLLYRLSKSDLKLMKEENRVEEFVKRSLDKYYPL